jgi:8-oxo-dGTP pyrophosphatase MutT (NUDIX family)
MERHFTVTTYVVDEGKVLLLFHPKHRKWLPPGGHLEEGETPPEGAKREVMEETGLEVEMIAQENVWINCWNAASFERPYMCLLESIPPYANVGAHQHMDLIYLAKPKGGTLIEDEQLRWFTLDEVLGLVTDEEIFGETQQTIKQLLA